MYSQMHNMLNLLVSIVRSKGQGHVTFHPSKKQECKESILFNKQKHVFSGFIEEQIYNSQFSLVIIFRQWQETRMRDMPLTWTLMHGPVGDGEVICLSWTLQCWYQDFHCVYSDWHWGLQVTHSPSLQEIMKLSKARHCTATMRPWNE